MAREVYSLEGAVLESQHLKAIAGLLKGPPALRRIATVALDEVRAESTREVDPLVPRAQRQLLLFRQAQLVGRLRGEHETALMMLEEGEQRISRFRQDRNWLLTETLQYMQRTAAMLVSQTDKLAVRNPGFASTMVAALHDWDNRVVAGTGAVSEATDPAYLQRQEQRERNKVCDAFYPLFRCGLRELVPNSPPPPTL